MANGTCSRRARVWARAVLPQPVGPIRRTLLLETSTSSRSGSLDLAAEHALVMVDDRDGQRLLHPLLADDVLVQVGHELAGRRDFLERGILPLMLLEEAVTHPDAMDADVRDRPARGHGNQRPSLDHRAGLGAIPPAEIAQHRGLRRGRALFRRHACHSRSTPNEARRTGILSQASLWLAIAISATVSASRRLRCFQFLWHTHPGRHRTFRANRIK